MTPEEWQTSSDVLRMIRFSGQAPGCVSSDRKLRLYAAAVCREKRRLAEAEGYEHDDRTPAEGYTWVQIAENWSRDGKYNIPRNYHPAVKADILRDVVGDPFAKWRQACPGGMVRASDSLWQQMLAHQDGIVIRLAQDAYDRREFSAMPILADACEDGGCSWSELLEHLRSSGKHWRGCWAVDLLLGKE